MLFVLSKKKPGTLPSVRYLWYDKKEDDLLETGAGHAFGWRPFNCERPKL